MPPAKGDVCIITNFERFPKTWTEGGVSGGSVYCSTLKDFWRLRQVADVMLVNCDPRLTFQLGLLFRLLPWMSKPVLAVDLVLPAPKTWLGRLDALVKRFSLAKTWHFVHHFRDLSGYQRYYGIGPDRSSYLPFKVNLEPSPEDVNPQSLGDYVLCLGRSERDYDTFFNSMEMLPSIPGAIPDPEWATLASHGSIFSRRKDQLPANVRVLADSGDGVSQIRMLRNARIVALPLIPGRIKASGISVYLNAMRMGKCVVTSEGPGTSDLLNGEAVLTEPQDASALAAVIQRLWEDDHERTKVATAGLRYALECGVEADSHRRVLRLIVQRLFAR